MSNCLLCFRSVDEGLSIFDWFFEKDDICGNCRRKFEEIKRSFPLESLSIYAFYQYNDFLESTLYQFKEGRDIALAPIFFKQVHQVLNDKYRHHTLVLMPSYASKIKERGFNHLEEMLKDTAVPRCICLVKNKEYKQSLHRGKTRRDIRNVLELDKDIIIPKSPLLLIDDVVTSGETLRAAYELLSPYNESISAFVLSVHPHFVELCDEYELKHEE